MPRRAFSLLGRDALLDADVLKASASFGQPAVLDDVAGYVLLPRLLRTLQLLGLYTDAADPKQTEALPADRLLFDVKVGNPQRRLLRSSVVDDVRKQLAKVGARGEIEGRSGLRKGGLRTGMGKMAESAV